MRSGSEPRNGNIGRKIREKERKQNLEVKRQIDRSDRGKRVREEKGKEKERVMEEMR